MTESDGNSGKGRCHKTSAGQARGATLGRPTTLLRGKRNPSRIPLTTKAGEVYNKSN